MSEKIRFNLGRTLDELGITRNKLAVESKTRPATVLDLVSGETKRIEIDTLINLLGALNTIASEQGINRNITISDIIEYIPDNDEETAN
jgi:DNA-binding Xre family transcriptional regulator